MRRFLAVLMLLATTTALTGCIGIYNNSDIFFKPIEKGMAEDEMLQQFGPPAFDASLEEKNIYGYKVRDNLYVIAVGIYEGYDLMVTCEDGEVTKIDKVIRPKTFSLFQPVPWAEGME